MLRTLHSTRWLVPLGLHLALGSLARFGLAQQPLAFAINTAAVTADTDVVVTASYAGVSRSATIKVKAPVTIEGKVRLEAAVNSIQPVTFEFRPQDGGAPIVRTRVLHADGSFSFANVPPLAFRIAVKGHKWLQKVISVDASAGSVSGISVSLPAGDVVEDNSVDSADLSAMADAFFTAPGDALWNENADLNCDGTVEITDLGLLADNFNKSGDP